MSSRPLFDFWLGLSCMWWRLLCLIASEPHFIMFKWWLPFMNESIRDPHGSASSTLSRSLSETLRDDSFLRGFILLVWWCWCNCFCCCCWCWRVDDAECRFSIDLLIDDLDLEERAVSVCLSRLLLGGLLSLSIILLWLELLSWLLNTWMISLLRFSVLLRICSSKLSASAESLLSRSLPIRFR